MVTRTRPRPSILTPDLNKHSADNPKMEASPDQRLVASSFVYVFIITRICLYLCPLFLFLFLVLFLFLSLPSIFGLRSLVFFWSLVFGLWSLVFGLWSLVFGLWSLVFGLWSLVFGLWSLYVRLRLRLTLPLSLPLSLSLSLSFFMLFLSFFLSLSLSLSFASFCLRLWFCCYISLF